MVMVPMLLILLQCGALMALVDSPGLSMALFPVRCVAMENGRNAARC